MLKAPIAPAGSPPAIVAALKDISQWVLAVLRGPSAREPYSISALPDATQWNGTTLPISDGAGGVPTVTAINGSWTYPDGTTI